jgi:hypothetical protein
VDNADEPNLLRPVFPRGSQGRVLLTSRAQQFDMLGIARKIEVRELLPEEALQFLLRRTGREFWLTRDQRATLVRDVL